MRKLFYFTLLILGVIILFSAESANAQTGVTLYQNISKGGSSKDFSSGEYNLTDYSGCSSPCSNNWNDCASSIKVSTTPPPACNNNGVKEGSELCDCGGGSCTSAQLGNKTCQDLGFTGGTLACESDCTFNTAGCTGGGGGGGGIIEIQNPLEAASFEAIVNNLIDFIFKIAIVLAPLMILVGGFLFLTSAGDLQKVQQAKRLMLWAAVGFVIVLLAKGVMGVIESIIGIE